MPHYAFWISVVLRALSAHPEPRSEALSLRAIVMTVAPAWMSPLLPRPSGVNWPERRVRGLPCRAQLEWHARLRSPQATNGRYGQCPHRIGGLGDGPQARCRSSITRVETEHQPSRLRCPANYPGRPMSYHSRQVQGLSQISLPWRSGAALLPEVRSLAPRALPWFAGLFFASSSPMAWRCNEEPARVEPAAIDRPLRAHFGVGFPGTRSGCTKATW
jgi:hypothetical protein